MYSQLQSQGRIILSNPRLFDEMRRTADSTAAVARRMHIDSPGYTDDDDDKYKYVSPNVEDFDDSQDKALAQSTSARDVSNGQYLDVNRQQSGNSSLTAQPSRSANRSVSQVSNSTYRAVKPINTPLTADEERELEELRQEELYQAKLRDKLKTESEQTNNIYIPRLHLSDSENEEEKRITKLYKDSLDINLRDSLDDLSSHPSTIATRQPFQPQDSLEMSSRDQGGVDDGGKHGKERAGLDSQERAAMRDQMAAMTPPPLPQNIGAQMGEQTYHSQPSQGPTGAPQQPPYDHRLPGPHPTDEQRLQALVGPEQGGYPQPGMVVDGDVRLQQIFQEYGAPPMGYPPMMPGYGMAGAPGGTNFSSDGLSNSYPQYYAAGYNVNPNGVPYTGPIGGQPFVINQGLDNVVQYPNGPPEEHKPELDSAEELNFYTETARRVKQGLPFQHSAMQRVRPGNVPAKPEVDHITKNKERLYKPPSGKKYRNIHAAKKEVNKENVPGPSGSHRGSLPASKTRGSQANDMDGEDAEALWRRRSMSLSQQKEHRLSGGKKTQSGMKKFSSDSRVNGPYSNTHTPGQSRGSQPQAFTEPVRSSVMPRPSDNSPITHTMLTEDGQRISVDINLKMISPTGPGPSTMGYRHPSLPNSHKRNSYGDITSPQHARGSIPQDVSPSHQYDTGNPASFFQPLQRVMPPSQDVFRPAHPQQLQQQQQQMMIGHQAVHMPHMAGGYEQQMYQLQQQDIYLEDVYNNDNYHQNGVKPPTPGSPYRVLPPIGSADSVKGRDPPLSPTDLKPALSPGRDNKNINAVNQGSYMDAFKKQKTKQVDYKAYTLKDYRNINKEVRLTGLGPDVDSETLRERREKAMRQQDYARQVQERNRAVVKPGKAKNPEAEESDIATRRKVAIEYAKSVPKPKVRPKQEIPVETSSPPRSQVPSQRNSAAPAAANTGRSTAGARSTAMSNRPGETSRVQSSTQEPVDLEELQRRHQLEKQKADLIRQNIQGVS